MLKFGPRYYFKRNFPSILFTDTFFHNPVCASKATPIKLSRLNQLICAYVCVDVHICVIIIIALKQPAKFIANIVIVLNEPKRAVGNRTQTASHGKEGREVSVVEKRVRRLGRSNNFNNLNHNQKPQ